MKKGGVAALCLLLLLSACRAEKEDGFSGKEGQTAAAGFIEEGDMAGAGVAETGEDSEKREEYETDFLRMVSELEGIRPGSAGSSLRAYSAACAVLDFAERHGEGGEEWLKGRLEEYLEDAGKDKTGQLLEGWQAAKGAAQELLEKGTRELEALLSDAGSPNQYETYRWESYGPVAAILEQQLGTAGEAQ